MSLRKIIDKSVNFILKNILWITLLGSIISLPGIFLELRAPSAEPSNSFVTLKYALILRLISLILTPLLAGTVTILLGEQFLGRSLPWYRGFQKSLKRWIPFILLQLVVGAVVGLGSILLIIPGIIAMCATTCAIPAMMLEDLDPMKAFHRSWDLTKNHRLRIFRFSCLPVLATALASGILLAITTSIPMDPLYKDVLSVIIHAPFQALWPAIATLLFFDLRIRKEAMDLEEEANTISVAAVKVT